MDNVFFFAHESHPSICTMFSLALYLGPMALLIHINFYFGCREESRRGNSCLCLEWLIFPMHHTCISPYKRSVDTTRRRRTYKTQSRLLFTHNLWNKYVRSHRKLNINFKSMDKCRCLFTISILVSNVKTLIVTFVLYET